MVRISQNTIKMLFLEVGDIHDFAEAQTPEVLEFLTLEFWWWGPGVYYNTNKTYLWRKLQV